ncbi:TonB-dependent receptor domain-containing protein [Altererythrobacter xiamenensis]|nr:TonB-dependent receptor [Altererythrobacter xiamenensis]
MSTRFNKASLLAGTVMAGAMIATPVYAQDEDNEPALQAEPDDAELGQTIVVTGSRIARRNVETAAPIAVVTDEEFTLSGAVNVENVVNTLPQVVPGTTSFSNNPGNGTATLNLRGLGTNRNLVLVNGRRWMFYDVSQVVDLNTIPNFLIDTVDVVTGGASAVYGSDAMAGVVNFRLRQVDGVELGGQYAITDRGDGESYQIHGAIGTSFDDGRGSATVFAEYYNRSSVFQGDRAFSNVAVGAETFGDDLQAFGSSTVPYGRVNTPGTVAIDEDGNTAPLAAGLTIDDAIFPTASVAQARNGETYNYAPVNYLQLPQERYLMGGYADYEFSDGHSFYTEVAYVNNRVAQELAATPVTGTFNVDLATIQPFVDAATFAEFQQLDANEAAASALRVANGLAPLAAAELGVVSTFIQRRVIETGRRNSLDERNAFRVLGGVTGPINDYMQYDAHYFYARTRNANIQAGNVSRSAFQAGLDGTGTPINVFGPGTLTPEMVDAITIQAQNGDISTLEVANATISGTFGDFAVTETSSPIGFAIGAEYRGVAAQFIPDTALSSGDVIGFNAGDPTEGSYNVKDVFAELNIPIDFGGMSLELDGKARYSDYSLDTVGGVWAYAGGVKFQPVPDITLRGQYQRAVRAPNIAELFQGSAIGFPGATDPCSTAAAGTNATLNALCAANGVPTGAIGNPDLQINAQIPALFGGNPNLSEETSDSWTVGVVLQPSFIPGLTITADYFDITVDNAISTVSLQRQFDLCFNQVQDLGSSFCAPFIGTRDETTGSFTTANPPFLGSQNIATFSTTGVDLEVNYSSNVPFSLLTDQGDSRINFSFLGTYTDSFEVQEDPLATPYDCAGRFGLTCGEPQAKYKWTSRLSWIDGPLTTSLRWRHLSSIKDDESVLTIEEWESFNGIGKIDSYDLFDLSFSFAVTENFELGLGVNNLLDKLPGTPTFDADGLYVTNRPNSLLLGDNQEQANTYPSTYDVLGRRYFASASFKF